MMQRPEIIVELCRGYEDPKSAMPCGTILRQALAFDTIAAVVLYDESQRGEKAVQLNSVDVGKKQTGRGVFWQFFQWINKGSFEVSADAFTTFRVRTSVGTTGDETDHSRNFSQNTNNLSPTTLPSTMTCSLHNTTIRSFCCRNHMSQNDNPSNCSANFCWIVPTML